MIVHGFDMYRVYISAPGDLHAEIDACRNAISEVNERVAMPEKTLLVSVGMTYHEQIEGFRSAVADNVRKCTYFIQIFEDDWGPRNLFRKMFYLAADCRDDAAMPMRDVVVCLKAAPRETDPEILAFRKELEDRGDVQRFHFVQAEELKAQLIGVCSGWVRSILETRGAGS